MLFSGITADLDGVLLSSGFERCAVDLLCVASVSLCEDMFECKSIRF